MAEIKASFFVECEELLESLQDGLQAMSDGEHDEETINVVFRAAHSIKGGAGAFGLDQLVSFAHQYETVLDLVRAGKLVPDAEALRSFFSAADILSDLVRASRDGTEIDGSRRDSVLGDLAALAGENGDTGEEEADTVDFQPMALSLDLPALDLDAALDTVPGDDAEGTTFRISFKPHPDLYGSGNEPLFILRSLSKLGRATIRLVSDEVPVLSQLDDDKGYLSWEIELATDFDQDFIDEAFEFVTDVCDLEITQGPGTVSPAAVDAVEPQIGTDVDAPDTHEQIDVIATASQTTVAPPDPSKASEKAAPVQAQSTIRVGLDKIDRLMNLVGELVINQAMLSQSMSEAGVPANSDVAQGLDEFMQLTRDIQDSVMTIRAQPVKSLFQRMSRIVREASAELGKNVRLKTEGETTEVDKTVIERLADPLTHMIRNAVDHGLESNEKRAMAGKKPEGTVTLSAAHRSGRVIIEVSDDGGGINREKVRQKAVENGLIAEDAQLSDTEIDGLLFMPGFSTATEISALSGRGVGMDVVKTAIQSLGGRVTIKSRAGKGTKFSISLPLTLAVLDGMVIEVAGETLVMPLGSILGTLTLTDDNLRKLDAGNYVVEIRGGFAPLIDLGVSLGYREKRDSYQGAIVLVIGSEDGTRSTIVVDSIQDQRQVVIKGLQSIFSNPPGVAAATILGDGQIALILDPIELTRGRAPLAAAA